MCHAYVHASRYRNLRGKMPKLKILEEAKSLDQTMIIAPEEALNLAGGLIGMKPVIEFLMTCLWTSHVTGERPVSVLLVAAPGHGKTSVLARLKSNWTYFTDDLTSREISHALTENPDMCHLMLSDFTSIFARKNTTAELTCNILRRLIEEGMDVDSYTGRHIGSSKRIGFISAIPPDDLESRKISEQLAEGGFASRFIIAKYTYCQKTKREIHDYIRSDAYTKDPENKAIRFPERRSEVKIPERIAQDLNFLALDIKRDPLGARAHHHLRALVKASALEQGRIEANQSDFKKIEQYSEFFTKRGKIL